MPSLNSCIGGSSTGARPGAPTRWSASTSHRKAHTEISSVKPRSNAKATGPVPPMAQGSMDPDIVQVTWRTADNLRSRQQRTQAQQQPGPTPQNLRATRRRPSPAPTAAGACRSTRAGAAPSSKAAQSPSETGATGNQTTTQAAAPAQGGPDPQ
jgi:hypothetical protein